MDSVTEAPQVEVDVQDIINILTQRIAQLELSNAAQQAHIGALLKRLVTEGQKLFDALEGEETEQFDQPETDSFINELAARRRIKEETEAIPPEQE